MANFPKFRLWMIDVGEKEQKSGLTTLIKMYQATLSGANFLLTLKPLRESVPTILSGIV